MDPEELRGYMKKVAIVGSFFVLAVVLYWLHWRAVLIAYAIIVGLLATLAILIQSGKGGGLAASLGGIGADSLLGTHSATPIAKATYVMLGLTVLILLLIARLGPVSAVVEEQAPMDAIPTELPAPEIPAGTPAPAAAETPAAPAAAPTADALPAAPPAGEPATR